MSRILIPIKFLLREAEIKRQQYYMTTGRQIPPSVLVKHLAWKFKVTKASIRRMLEEDYKDNYGEG